MVGIVTIIDTDSNGNGIVYTSPTSGVKNGQLAFQSQWQYFDTQTFNGRDWYYLGGQQWISDEFAAPNVRTVYQDFGTAKVGAWGAFVYNAPNGKKVTRPGTQQYLQPGSQWSFNEALIDTNGEVWVNAGHSQWLTTKNVSTDKGGSGSGAGNSSVLTKAKNLLGYFTYGAHTISALGGTIDNPSRWGSTDCSGFVWLALRQAGKGPSDMAGFTTDAMEYDARYTHTYLRQIDSSEARAGDIIIVNVGDGKGPNGHTGILSTDWNGARSSSAIQILAPGYFAGNVQNLNVHDSFYSLLGSGRIIFARPV